MELGSNCKVERNKSYFQIGNKEFVSEWKCQEGTTKAKENKQRPKRRTRRKKEPKKRRRNLS